MFREGVGLTVKEKTYVKDIDRSMYDFRKEEKDAYRVNEGLTPEIVEQISKEKKDPAWMQLFVGKNAKLCYSTIENWSKNMYNLNTKRATVAEGGTMEWVSGSFGSHTSYLYPMTIPERKRFSDGVYRYHLCGKRTEPGYRC